MRSVNSQQLWPFPVLGKQLPFFYPGIALTSGVVYSTESGSKSEGSRKKKEQELR